MGESEGPLTCPGTFISTIFYQLQRDIKNHQRTKNAQHKKLKKKTYNS